MNEALNHPYKIKDSQNEHLLIEIANAVMLMGVPQDRLPDEMQKQFLISFIKENFKFYSVAEIRTAFTMAARGDLNVDCNHYGSFSPEYFARIMKGYNEHRQKEAIKLSNDYIKDKPEYVPDTAEKLKIQKEFDMDCIVPIFDQWKRYNFVNNGTIPMRLIFNSVIGFHKVLEFTKEQREAIYKQADEVIKERRLKMVEAKARSYAEHKEKLKMIEALELPQTRDDQTKDECYRICIERAFQKLSDSGKHFKDLL